MIQCLSNLITLHIRVNHLWLHYVIAAWLIFLPDGTALPLTFDSAATSSNQRAKIHKVGPKKLPEKPQRRSEESCRSGNSYVREKFQPGPRSMFAKLIPPPTPSQDSCVTHACILLLPGGWEEYTITFDFMQFFSRNSRHTHVTTESILLNGINCFGFLSESSWLVTHYTFTAGDLEKEKLRLQNIMSTGQEGPTAAQPTKVSGRRDQRLEEETDRFQEGRGLTEYKKHINYS